MEACYFTQLHLQNYPKVTVLEQRGQSSTFPYRPAFETSRIAFETSSLYKCQNSKMFITAAFVLFFIKLRWPKNKSLYDTILVLIIFFYPWKSEWVDWMIHWFSKSIFLKKKGGGGRGSLAVTQWCQRYKHNPPFLIERPLQHPEFHYTIGIVTTGQCHDSSTRWRSCNHARPFPFVPPLSFTKLELFGLHLLRDHDRSDFGK